MIPLGDGAGSANPSPRLIVLQPHPDDVALSIGGILQGRVRDVVIYSVFDDSEARDRRRREDRLAAHMMNANLVSLGLHDGSAAEFQVPPSKGLILAPAGVSRHLDHLAVRAAAIEAGCHAFWEDVAFWGIYGSSVDDRVLFTVRDRDFVESLAVLAVDITAQLKHKRKLLEVFVSQSPDAWRPIRYARTIGLELGREGRAFERLLIRKNMLDEVANQLRYVPHSIGVTQYGLAHLDTYVVDADAS